MFRHHRFSRANGFSASRGGRRWPTDRPVHLPRRCQPALGVHHRCERHLRLRSVYSSKVAEALGNGTANSTLVGQWADLGNPNQRWTTIQVSTTP
ncbi:RICIN domain-containing protein [Amycolatopsis keratiniphila]|uniref:RICIN domain-containing protein n=1 Tax=Amycolatopsis keratiniphila TaxID=129921 RepID=UPI000F51790D